MNIDDDDKTIVTSNCTSDAMPTISANKNMRQNLAAAAQHLFGSPLPQYLNAITIATWQAIADMGATSIFVMERMPIHNLRPAIHPLTINLLDGSKVKSTHTCNITIPGLPTVLVGHVVPKLAIATLIRIRVLCDAGCEVMFTKTSCNVIYDGKIILHRNKDPSTNLWTLPIKATNEKVKTTQNEEKGTQGPHACHQAELLEARRMSIPKTPMLLCPKINSAQHSHKGNKPKASQLHPSSAQDGAPHLACFTHSIKTRANGVKFAHQALGNPKISSLLKAV
jgi:hypothetical protein